MAQARQVAFEVYYLQYGRWQIHHRYGSGEREDAIEEAKRLDTQGHFDAACVVRESTDPTSGVSSESVIYHSPKLKTKPPVSFITAGQDGAPTPSKAAAPPGSAADNARREATKRDKKAAKDAFSQLKRGKEPDRRSAPTKNKKKASEAKEPGDWTAALPSLLIAFLLACAVGTACGVGAFYGIKALASRGFNPGIELNQILLIGAWAGGWALTFFPLMRRALDQVKPAAGAKPTAPVRSPAKPRGDASAKRSPTEEPRAAPDRPKSIEQMTAELLEAPVSGGEAEVGPDAGSPEGANATDSQTPMSDEATDTPEGSAAPEDAGPPPLERLAGYLTGLVEEAKRLTAGAVMADQFLRFGVVLFLAGAAETFARFLKVPDREAIGVLGEHIQAMGAPESLAKGFAANIDEYLLDQRYFDMYATGRGGALRITKDAAADSGIAAAIEDWRKPKPAPGAQADGDSKHYDGAPGEREAHGFVAVLFTDIVNSTANLTARGDQWLIQVVRAHNDIVREAIATHGGREIKHTGDGIMASFPAVSSSVAAGLAMQDGIRRFSDLMPDLAFELCVGISAGEPIHESGDLFGTPVNLAARVLSIAGPGQTAVSTVVREMCHGKSFEFDELGKFELKGFSEPQPIYLAKDRRKAARGGGASDQLAATG
jgi:adenylate cyclase